VKIKLLPILFLLITTSVYPQWFRQTNGLEASWNIGFAIDACDKDHAFIVASHSIFCITNNGGAQWNQIIWPYPGESGSDVSMTDPNNIWVAIESGKIYYSPDAGQNWVLQYFNPERVTFLNYIEMFDNNNGIAMGDAIGTSPALFLKTTDGGRNWIDINRNYLMGLWSGDTWRRLDFVDKDIGYFYGSGENPQKLFKTLDGGATWLQTNFTGYTQLVKFFDANFGFVFDQEVFRVTYNGGVDWQSVSFKHAWSNDLEQVPGDENKIWFTDSANLFLSKNTGVSFELFPVAGFAKARDIVFTDKDNGWVLCDQGKLFKIENASVITSIAAEEKLPTDFILSQNYPNPFNPTTTITYEIPEESFVSLKIFDLLGREINTLVSEVKQSGKYEAKFNGENLTSGVYIYKLIAAGNEMSRKMLLIK